MHAFPWSWLSSFTTLALGAAIGVLGGLFGIGGGLFAIPVLGLFYGYDQQHAQGTSLVMSVPNLMVALWSYARRGGMDRKIAWMLALAGAPCTLFGAIVATRVQSHPLRHAFGLFVIGIAGYVLVRTIRPARLLRPLREAHAAAAIPVGILGGTLSGIFSVGGAVAAVPLIGALFGVTQATAQGLGLALVAPGSLANIATFARAGDVDWPVGITLALGGVLTVPAGVALAYRLPDRTLRTIFGVLLAASGAALLVRG